MGFPGSQPAASGDRLTAKGVRAIRKESLDAIFGGLKRDASAGDHRTAHAGRSNEVLPETRPYEFGDAISNLAATNSLQNALR